MKGNRKVYRIVSDKIPELVLGLNDLDYWEALEGSGLIEASLIADLGEKLDNHNLGSHSKP